MMQALHSPAWRSWREVHSTRVRPQGERRRRRRRRAACLACGTSRRAWHQCLQLLLPRAPLSSPEHSPGTCPSPSPSRNPSSCALPVRRAPPADAQPPPGQQRGVLRPGPRQSCGGHRLLRQRHPTQHSASQRLPARSPSLRLRFPRPRNRRRTGGSWSGQAEGAREGSRSGERHPHGPHRASAALTAAASTHPRRVRRAACGRRGAAW
mmetsp:Transcript_973/g.2076  ORF Transcript_973/g.2076 Transcript_973/m.2076 type:complete len:209 (+) Transcript_973:1161-1787(+)